MWHYLITQDWYEQSQSFKLNDQMHFLHLIELSVKKVHIILTLYLKSYPLEVLKFIRKLFLPPSPHSLVVCTSQRWPMLVPFPLLLQSWTLKLARLPVRWCPVSPVPYCTTLTHHMVTVTVMSVSLVVGCHTKLHSLGNCMLWDILIADTVCCCCSAWLTASYSHCPNIQSQSPEVRLHNLHLTVSGGNF